MALLFTKTHAEWAAESSLSDGSINDHCYSALNALTGLSSNINDMMYHYLSNGQGLSGSLSDMVLAWDKSFNVFLLLETDDSALLETDDKIILE